MKYCKICGIEKNFDNSHKCNKSADGFQTYCKQCKKITGASGNAVRRARYYAKHKERHIESLKTCDQVKRRIRDARWAQEHPDRVKISRKKFYEANRGRLMAGNRRREKIKSLASKSSPGHLLEIEGFYLFCRMFNGFQVDHIIPLKGKQVSGLHVPSNLQILSKRDNVKKGNKFLENDNGCV